MGAILDPIADVIEDVIDVVKDVGDFVQDDILIPVVDAVEDTAKAMADDPVRTIAYAAAAASGQWWALPLLSGADTAMQGGDIGDILEASAKAYVVQNISPQVGSYAGAAVGGATGNAVLAGIATGAATAATSAVVLGQDPLKAALTGGVAAGVSAAMTKVRTNLAVDAEGGSIVGNDPATFDTNTGAVTDVGAPAAVAPLPAAALKVIETQLAYTLSGQEGAISPEVMSNAILQATVTGKTVQQFVNEAGYEPSDAQIASITNGIIRTTSAAINGGDITYAALTSIAQYGAKELINSFDTVARKTIDEVTGGYQETEKKAGEVDFIAAEYESAVTDYNTMQAELESRSDEQARLKTEMDEAKASFEARPTQSESDAYDVKIKAYNAHVTDLNKDYAETYKPKLTEYKSQVETLRTNYKLAGDEYLLLRDDLTSKADKLDGALKPSYDATNKAFVKGMTNNGFNADEYMEVNNLTGVDDEGAIEGEPFDPYLHWLTVGKEEKLPTNAADYNAQAEQEKQNLILKSVKAAGLDLSTIGKDGLKELQNKIESTYGFNLEGLKKADPIVLGNDVAKFYLDEALKPNPKDSIDEAFAREKFNEKVADISNINFEEIKELVGDPELQLMDKTAVNAITNTLNIPQTDIARGNAAVNIDSDGNLTWKQITSTAPYWDKEKNLLVRNQWDFYSGKYFPVEHTTGQQLYNSYNEVGDLTDYGFGMGPDSADSASINAFVGVDDYKEYKAPVAEQGGVGISNIVPYDPTTLNDLIDSGSTLWVETAAKLDEASAEILDNKYVSGMTAAAKSVYEYAESVITLDPKNSKLLKEAASVLPSASGKTIDLFNSIGQLGNELNAVATFGIGPTIASGDADALGQTIGGNKDFGRSSFVDGIVNDLAGYTSNLQSDEFKTINNDFDKKYEEAAGFWQTTNVIYDGVKNNPWEIIVGKVAPEALVAAFGTKGFNLIKGGGKLIVPDISKNLVNKGAKKKIADRTSNLMSKAYDKTLKSLSNKVATGASTLTQNQIQNTAILASGAALTAEATNQLQNVDYSNNDSNLSWWENIWGTPVAQQLSQVGAKDTEVAVDEYTEYEVYKYETPEIKKVIEKAKPTYASSARFSDFFNLGLPETSDTSKIQTGSASGNLIANYNPEVNNILTEARNNPELVPFALTQLEDLDLPQETKTNLFSYVAPNEYQTKKDIKNKFIAAPTPYKPSAADIDAFTGKLSNQELDSQFMQYVDQRYFSADDAKEVAKSEGVTLSQEEAESYAKQENDDVVKKTLTPEFDTRGTTETEAKEFFESIGYTPNQEEINEFTQINMAEAASKQNITEYGALNTTTQEEVEKALTDAGYNVDLLPAEFVSSFAKQGLQTETEANLLNEAENYRVDENEARLAFEKAGIPDATQTDLSKLIGQYDQNLLSEKVTEALPAARYNTLRNVIGANQEAEAKRAGDLGALIQGQKTETDSLKSLLTEQGAKTDAFTSLVGGPANVNTGDVATGLYSNIADLGTNYDNRINETQTFIDNQFKQQAETTAMQRAADDAANKKAAATKATQNQQLQNTQNLYSALQPQAVDVKQVELANITNPYDFKSIFRDAGQEAFYNTPYRNGGQVVSINDKLLKLIGGN